MTTLRVLAVACLSCVAGCTTTTATPPESVSSRSPPTTGASFAGAPSTTQGAIATVQSTSPAPEEPSAPPDSPASTSHTPVIDAPYWATPQPVVDKMLELAAVQKSDIVYDLGCGDARSLVTAAQRYGARGFGFDIDYRRVNESRENVRRNHLEDLVDIGLRDIFFVDLSKADVVFLFMLERVNGRLKPQFEKMRPGSRIVAHEFPIPGIQPDRIVRVLAPPDGPSDTGSQGAPKEHVLYLWKMPWAKSKR